MRVIRCARIARSRNWPRLKSSDGSDLIADSNGCHRRMMPCRWQPCFSASGRSKAILSRHRSNAGHIVGACAYDHVATHSGDALWNSRPVLRFGPSREQNVWMPIMAGRPGSTGTR